MSTPRFYYFTGHAMQLIFIYGPPAAGKLTVAKELATITGYKLFHNHLTVDLGVSLFEFGSEPYIRFVRGLRLQAFRAAAEAHLDGLIFTFVYSPGLSDPFIQEVMDLAKNIGFTVHFVHLYCRQECLEERVTALDRTVYRKIDTVERLHRVVSHQRPSMPISFVESVDVDTSDQPPSQSAGQIIRQVRTE